MGSCLCLGGGKSFSYKDLKRTLAIDRNRYSKSNMVGYKVGYPLIKMLRWGFFFHNKKNFPAKLFLKILKPFYFVYRVWAGVDIMIGTRIGAGIKFPHPVGVVISSKTIIGENCTIHQHVTLGYNPFGNRIGNPVIGDNVVIYAGACICGNIHIGNNVVVGANAVVTKDIPDNCIVAGVPAKIISNDSKSVMKEAGMEFFNISS